MDAVRIDFTSSHYELISALDLEAGDRVRLPQTVIDGRALGWQIGAVVVERVEEKADGVVFIWLAPESVRPGGDRFLMLCGAYLAAGVARIANHTRRESPVKRETTIRVVGEERVILTEMGGKIRTAKQLEAAHTKAVKAALIEMRKAGAPAVRKRGVDRGEGRTGPSAKLAAQWERGAFTSHGTPGDATKPFPKVSFTTTVPEYLVRIAPNEYATAEAAESMNVAERPEEVLPGLAPGRAGRKWVLNHLASASDENPQGAHIGPVFKTRKRAQEVARADLARLDWTRTKAEIEADEETMAVLKFLRLREFVAASARNAWAMNDLRAAEEKVRSFSVDVAA